MQIFDEFKFHTWRIPVYGTKEEPYFRAADVGKVIDYSLGNARHMCEMVDDNEKILVRTNGTGQVKTWGGNRTPEYFLTEYGLYEVLMQSRKPIAKEFKSVIKHILRGIRMDHDGSFSVFDEMPFYDDDGNELCTGPGGEVMTVKEFEAYKRSLNDENN